MTIYQIFISLRVCNRNNDEWRFVNCLKWNFYDCLLSENVESGKLKYHNRREGRKKNIRFLMQVIRINTVTAFYAE